MHALTCDTEFIIIYYMHIDFDYIIYLYRVSLSIVQLFWSSIALLTLKYNGYLFETNFRACFSSFCKQLHVKVCPDEQIFFTGSARRHFPADS
jgi:hypothetical protein